MARRLCAPFILGLSFVVLAAGTVEAQESPRGSGLVAQGETRSVSAGLLASPGDKASDDEAKGDEPKEKGEAEPKGAEGAKEGAEPGPAGVDFEEQQNKTYHYLGLRGRMTVIPQFMLGLFGAEGGKTVWSPQVGPELAVRRNGFEYDVWLTFASYPMGNAPFKAKDDPEQAWELVRSDIKTISVGSDFLWSTKLHPRLSFVYGGGAGIGVVFGNLYRTQSYPTNGAPGDPANYQPCVGPGSPNGNYCGYDNDHYAGYKEPSWLSGGAKPVVFPWVAPLQLGLRWKASPKLVARLDMGVAFPGPFFFGLAVQHGLF